MNYTISWLLLFLAFPLLTRSAEPAFHTTDYNSDKNKGLHFSYYLGIGVSGNAGLTLAPAPQPSVGVVAYIPVEAHDQPSYAFILGFDVRLFNSGPMNIRAGLAVEQMNYSGKTVTSETAMAGPPAYILANGGGWDYSLSENFIHLPVSFIYRISAQNKKYISLKAGLTESFLFSEQCSDVPAVKFTPQLMTFVHAGMIYKIRNSNNGGPAVYLEPEFKYQVTPNADAADKRQFWSFELKLRIAHGS
ncbi:MAG TPA: hypothetical protein VNZ86_18220 [Bacteroidia bacterium]|jgi:hypothetical protein|nr:hypothetical protein [Bacteroidia bacterium]